MKKIDMIQEIEQTKEEKTAMYMKLTKKELVEMLIECNDVLDDLKVCIEMTKLLKTEEAQISSLHFIETKS